MGTKKDIGNVFSDRLKDYKQAPNGGLWDDIEAALKENTKPLLPFWMKIGLGTVIALIVGSYFITQNQTPSTIEHPTVVTVPADSQNERTLENPTDKRTADYLAQPSEEETTTTAQKIATPSGVAASESPKSSRANAKMPKNAVTALIAKNGTSLGVLNSNDVDVIEDRTVISTATGTVVQSTTATQTQSELLAMQRYKSQVQKELEASRKATFEEAQKEYQTWLAVQEKKLKAAKFAFLSQQRLAATNKLKPLHQKKSKAPKKLKLPKTEEDRSIARTEATTYAWAFSPYISSLRYNSFVKGSSIDDRLKNNPREGESTLGYGMMAERSLSERGSMRFGIGNSPLKYRTDNFQVSIVDGAVNIFELQGLSPNEVNQNGIPLNPEATAFFEQNDVVSIEQNISYLEFPVEYRYKLLNKRIELSALGGASLFVLTENSVFAIGSNNKLLIGNENNLHNLTYGLHLGAGLHYNVTKNWRFNIEPIVRMQLNPYQENAGNFRPYYTSLQFGLSYKFK